jgi:hypothetical protein
MLLIALRLPALSTVRTYAQYLVPETSPLMTIGTAGGLPAKNWDEA